MAVLPERVSFSCANEVVIKPGENNNKIHLYIPTICECKIAFAKSVNCHQTVEPDSTKSFLQMHDKALTKCQQKLGNVQIFMNL